MNIQLALTIALGYVLGRAVCAVGAFVRGSPATLATAPLGVATQPGRGAEIARLCNMARMPEQTTAYILSDKSIEQVREDIVSRIWTAPPGCGPWIERA